MAVTLLRHGLWSATPANTKTAFSLELMELCVAMQLYGCISIQAFCTAMNGVDNLMGLQRTAKKAPDLYRNLLSTINDYRFHRTEMSRVGQLKSASLYSCPICPKERASCVLAMDGNFGLVHKRRGGNLDTPRHDNSLFCSDEEVQEFVRGMGNTTTKSDCSQFQAGSALRAKNKTEMLDVTGVFGCICQHDFPMAMVNLKHGERLSYPTYVLEKLAKDRDPNTKQLVMYDIACKLHKYLNARNSSLTDQYQFSVPAFHCFAHQMACQLSYGQRCTPGAALNDGEGMERLWSFLRKFAGPSKQMTLANRKDLLTDALLAYARRSFKELGNKLMTRMTTAEKLQTTAKAEFEAIEQQVVPTGVAGDSSSWLADWKQEISAIPESAETEKLSLREEYSYHIVQIAEKMSQFQAAADLKSKETLAVQLRQLEVKAAKLQGRLKLKTPLGPHELVVQNDAATGKQKLQKKTISAALALAKERMFLEQLMSKYSDGQSVAARLGKQLHQNSLNVSRIGESLREKGLPVTTTDLVDIDNQIYNNSDTSLITPSMRKAALARAGFDRASEAKTQIKSNMKSLIAFVHEKSEELKKSIKIPSATAKQAGEKHLLSVRRCCLILYQRVWTNQFSKYVDLSEYGTFSDSDSDSDNDDVDEDSDTDDSDIDFDNVDLDSVTDDIDIDFDNVDLHQA